MNPEDDFRRLIDMTLDTAEDLLASRADFWPFAACINTAGAERLVTTDAGAQTPKDEYPLPCAEPSSSDFSRMSL